MARDCCTLLGLLFLLALCVSPCHGQASVTHCNNAVPGLLKMARGVDVTTLDMTPQDLTGQHGYKHPIIQFTCAEGKTRTIAGKTYDLPDQIWTLSQIPGGWLTSSVEILKSSQEVRKSMSSEVGGGLQLAKFGFSASVSYKRMQHTVTNSSSYIEQVSTFFSGRRADFKLHFTLGLDPQVQAFIDNYLPASFQDNPSPYEEFIGYFGTHYFTTAKFGGMINLLLETRSSYYYGKSDSEVKKQAEASFLKILKAKGGYTGSVSNVDERFDQLTTKTIRYYGGNANLLSSQGLEQWQPTVPAHPWLFSGQLSPISALIKDSAKKASMEEAVTNHLLHAFLDELSRLLYGRLASWTAGSSTLNNLLSRVKTMQGERILVSADVEALQRDVEEQVIVPSWFTEKSKLCYQWYPDGDGGQCGGGAGRLLCAAPNSKTAYYRDDTDRRGGGCRMRWGIMATGQPSWFNDVQMCYRWHPDGDGGQCGGGAARELCARVNQYPGYYRDDTDRRGGGCQMSWRIVVPATAPAWAKNVHLCYEWYPDGDGGQCGGGAARRLCARANQWTAYYRDDTDRRSGGCQMRWGLELNH